MAYDPAPTETPLNVEAHDFAQACRCFELFTLQERHRVLEEFARLSYRSITARFFEAVHRVVMEIQTPLQ